MDAEAEFVAGGHVLPGPESQGTDLHLRFNVLADDGPDIVAVEWLLGQHERGAAGVALLAGLEEGQNRTPECGCGGELLHNPEEHGGMDVVSAGVHDAVVLRPPRDVVLFGNGQGVDVGAQHDGMFVVFGGFRPPDGCQHAGLGDSAVSDSEAGRVAFR